MFLAPKEEFTVRDSRKTDQEFTTNCNLVLYKETSINLLTRVCDFSASEIFDSQLFYAPFGLCANYSIQCHEMLCKIGHQY